MAKKIIIDLEANTSKAQNEISDIVKELKALNKEAVKTNEKLETGLKDVEKSAKDAGKGFASFSNILKGGLIITVLNKAFEFFKETLGKNQVVVDIFATTFEVLSIAFNDFINFIFNNVGGVVDVFKSIFSDPVQSIKDFGNAIKEGLINRFEQFKQTLGFVAKGIGDLFKGNFKDAVENFKQAGKESVDIITGQDQSLEKVKETIGNVVVATKNYVKQTVDAAQATVQLNKNAEKASVINQGLIEQYDIQAEQQRQIRDEERNTIDERIAANNRLKAVLEEQAATMTANAEQVLLAAQAQYDKNKSDENFIALQEAKNELLAVEAQVTGFMSEQKVNDLALEREKQELNQSNIDAEAERRNAQRQFDAEQIESEQLKLIAQKEALEAERLAEVERLENKRDLYQQGTQAYADAQNELLAYQQESGNREIDLDKKIAKAKQQTMTDALSNLATIVGENTKFGKAIAIVQAIRDTFAGANVALKSAPPPFNFVSAAAVVAAGIANVRSITSTPDPSPPSFAKGSSGGGSIPIAAPSAPPAFNVVGASGTNQLADAIAGQQGQPMKAYVVSGDVSTAQELDRNIVKGASIG